MQLFFRFIVGGALVSLFAVLGTVLKPKGFAGLFAAAPSVALATLSLTILTDGKSYAAIEAKSMIAGALAFCAYAVLCVYLMAIKHVRAAPATSIALLAWGLTAGVLFAALEQH
jgi:uncharacterized membrane protein (GlpM family)